MATVGTIVQAAGRKIGVKDMEVEEIVDGISALNMMLEQWQAISSIKNAVIRETFSINSGSASYSVGSGATIDTTWPTRIKSAFIRKDDTDHSLAVFSSEEYAFIGEKTESNRPVALYYERTYPNGTFFFWPTPDSSYSVHIWAYKIFTAYTASADDLALPPEYEPAIIFNLALEMAPEYTRTPSNLVIARAASTLKTIKNMNLHPIPQISTDAVCKVVGSSRYLFAGLYGNRLGSVTLPFVLRG